MRTKTHLKSWRGTWVIRGLALVTPTAVLLSLAACSQAETAPMPSRTVSLAEFSQPAPAPLDPVDPDPAPEAPDTPGDSDPSGMISEREVPPSVRWHGPDLRDGEPMIVDALVGQVNGRPIFVSEFFYPIEDELIAESQRLNQRDFTSKAAELVTLELRDVVINALLLAEAEGSLTEQQRVGIRFWLAGVKDSLVAKDSGSAATTRAKYRGEGSSLEDEVADIRNTQLIGDLLRRKIAPRVIISWRDIEREYETEYWQEKFNPPGTATIGRIRLTTASQADLIADVEARLEQGEDFMTLAESLNIIGGPILGSYEMTGRDLSEITITNEVLQDAVRSLKEKGETVGPFELGSTTWWVHVAELLRPQHRDLYDPDVQQQIAAALQTERSRVERGRYIESLVEKGIYDEIDEMNQRLVAIAILRYGPSS